MISAVVAATTSSVSSDVGSFLSLLAVALFRRRVCSPDHPDRVAADQAAFGALESLLAHSPVLRIEVDRHQLMVDHGATDPDDFVLRDLAGRLCRRQVGSVVFRDGIRRDEFAALLDELARESPGRRDHGPLALATVHLDVTPTAFEPLVLGSVDEVGGQIERLWRELAPAAAAGGSQSGGDVTLAAELERLGRTARGLELLRLLRKMARARVTPGEPPPRPSGDHDLREVVRSLLADWSLSDPSPKTHSHVLEVLARHDFVPTADGGPTDDSLRIVQMAIEVESGGDHLLEAIETAIDRGEIDDVIRLVEQAGGGAGVEAVKESLTAPANLCQILGDQRVTRRSVVTLLEWLGPKEIRRRLETSDAAERQLLASALAALSELPPGLAIDGALAA